MDDWLTFLQRARPSLDLSGLGIVLCLDPGETTGWALWHEGKLHTCGQEYTGQDPASTGRLVKWLDQDDHLRLIVYEEYRVRGNKFREHVGSEVVTIQHIGAIKVVADELGVPLWKQSAGMAKGFATDGKLRRWGLWQPNERHANDAIRHGIYYHLFVAGRSR